MLNDSQYHSDSKSLFQEHLYGDQFHIINSTYLRSILAHFGQEQVMQPTLSLELNILYNALFEHSVNTVAPRVESEVQSRMYPKEKNGSFKTTLIDHNLKIVVVDLARAGTEPTMICFKTAHYLFEAKNIRQDHFYINRTTTATGEVTGAHVSGSKIGGDIEKALVFFPDPMGATGGSIKRVYDYYLNKVEGKPLEMIALHLVITPEYVRRIKKDCPELKVFALRLDRGQSSEKVLGSTPGQYIEEEKGLNQFDYIVPGLGGVGEILNNSYC